MYKKLLSILFFILWSNFALYAQTATTEKQEQDFNLITSFLTAIANQAVRSDVILSQYVLISGSNDNEVYDYLEASIDEIRLNLQTKPVDQIEYIPFASLPKKETRDIDPEGKSTENMYFLRFKNRQMLAIYVEQDKIASFTLVSKGNKVAHFVTY